MNIGEHQFTVTTLVLANQEHTVLYHNDRIVGMIRPFHNHERVYFDETLIDSLFHDPATEFPDFINYLRNDNNNNAIIGIQEEMDYCHETLFELQMTYDPIIIFTQDLIDLHLEIDDLHLDTLI